MNIAYPYLAELCEDNRYFVHFIDIEEAITQGDTLEEAAFNASEVLSAMLECRLEDNEDIPEASICPEDGFLAYPEPKIQMAILMKKARGNRSIVELANAMNTTLSNVEKLENPRNSASLNQLNKVAKALGKRLVLSLE
jgi:antitoxin HicB